MGRELASLSASFMSAKLYPLQLKVGNKLGGPKSRIMALTSVLFNCQNCLVPRTLRKMVEVPLKLVVITLCTGDQLFDTLVLVSGVIQQVGDTCLQLSLDLLVMKIENILCLLSVARVLVFKDFTYSELVRGTSRSWYSPNPPVGKSSGKHIKSRCF